MRGWLAKWVRPRVSVRLPLDPIRWGCTNLDPRPHHGSGLTFDHPGRAWPCLAAHPDRPRKFGGKPPPGGAAANFGRRPYTRQTLTPGAVTTCRFSTTVLAGGSGSHQPRTTVRNARFDPSRPAVSPRRCSMRRHFVGVSRRLIEQRRTPRLDRATSIQRRDAAATLLDHLAVAGWLRCPEPR